MTPRPAGDSIARNTAFSFAIQIASAGFTAAVTLFLVRELDPRGYGTYALALSLGALATLPSDFGITSSAMRFIAERRGDAGAVARVMADALRLKLLAAGVVSVVLFAIAGLLARGFGNAGLAWPLRGIALAIFGQSVMLFFGGAFIAQARASLELWIVVAESATETAAVIALVLVGAGATGAAFGRAIGYAVGLGVGLVLTVRIIGRAGVRLRRAAGESRTRDIARYAGALAVVDWVFTFFAYLDTIVIGALLSSAAVGRFQAPMRIVGFLNMPAAALATGVAPRVAAHAEEGSNVASFVASLRGLIALQGAFLAPLVVWALPISNLLFGPAYGEGSKVLRAIAPYVFLVGIGTLVSQAVNYLGQARLRVPVAVVTLLVNLGIDLALVPRIGIVAGAIGTDVAYAIYVPAHVWICHRALRLPLAELGLTLVRVCAAAAGMGLVLLVLGTHDLSAGAWAAGAAAGPAAYLAVLLLTRELTPSALVGAASRAGGRLGLRT